jgi:hypothetical protein
VEGGKDLGEGGRQGALGTHQRVPYAPKRLGVPSAHIVRAAYSDACAAPPPPWQGVKGLAKGLKKVSAASDKVVAKASDAHADASQVMSGAPLAPPRSRHAVY